MNKLIDSKFGLINFVQEQESEYGNNNLFLYVAKTSNTKSFTKQKNFSETGGVSLNRKDAEMKAIGEGIERYCAAIYSKDHFENSTYNEASFDCVSPHEFALYSNDQYKSNAFPYKPFLECTPLNWVPSLELFSKKEVYVPASLVYVPYRFGANDTAIAQSISTGLACHVNYTKAMISGICEVIERDAFSITWQSMLSPPKIQLDSLTAINKKLLKILRSWHEEITLFNITTDISVPSILAVARNKNSDRPGVIVSAATHPNKDIAIKKSLEELAHTGKFMQQLHIQEDGIDTKEDDYSNIDSQLSHLSFWCQQSNKSKINFLFDNNHYINSDEIESCDENTDDAELQFLCQKIRGINEKIYICDLTTQDVRDLGYYVIRAILPSLNRLVMGHNIRCCGGERLQSVPEKLGYESIKENPYPHPFP